MDIPGTNERVTLHTDPACNEKIQQQSEHNIVYYATNPEEISERLTGLNHEWDIERTLEAQAATLAVVGVALGILVSRKWLLLPALVGGFLLQHAIQGWCPPLPILRRLGLRTQTEIERERYALKMLRGDFNDITTADKGNFTDLSQRVIEAVK